MLTTPISRRVFLKTGGALAGTLAFATGPIALLAPSRGWAMPLDRLSTHEGTVLLRFTRHLFPHPGLEDAVYALVVKDLDRLAEEERTHRLLMDGIASLDSEAGGDWLALSEAEQDRSVEALAGTPFFEQVRGNAVVSLYDNPLAYAHFGYQGAEGDGGYLMNGFNDLIWLSEPPKPDGGYLPHEVA